MSGNIGETTIFLTPEVAEKIDAVFRLAKPNEVLMLLWAEINEQKDVIVTDAYLPDQEVSGGYCEVTKKGLIAFPDEVGLERYSTVRGIWHSHVEGGAWWSGIDTRFLSQIKTPRIPFFISLVSGGNNIRGRVEIMDPFNAYFQARIKILGEEDTTSKYRAHFEDRVHIRPRAIVPTKKDKKKGKKGKKGKDDDVRPPQFGRYKTGRFTLDNPIYDYSGDPLCCGYKMSLLGRDRGSDHDVLYCRWCYNTVHVPDGWQPPAGTTPAV